MNRRNTGPAYLLTAIAGFAVATASTKAAEITNGTTAPTVDALDVSNLAAGTASQKWFNDIEHDRCRSNIHTCLGRAVAELHDSPFLAKPK